MTIGVFIPARTTSNRLPRKLLLPLGDTNLFEIACKKIALLPNHINKYALVYEEELIKIAQNNGLKILLRDKETIHMDDPIRVVMGAVEQAIDDYLMFLNPCLAFLKIETIEKAIEDFINSDVEYGTSVKPFHNWLFDSSGSSLNPINYSSLNTKNVNNYYQMAHCFHIFNRKQFLEDGQMLKPGHLCIQVSEEETIDVDTMEEYLYAKWKWENL